MNIIITGKNFSLSEANKAYIYDKLEALSKVDDSLIRARVEVDAEKKERENGKFRVEIWAEGKHDVQAGAHGHTFFESVDHTVGKIKRQLIDAKEKERPY